MKASRKHGRVEENEEKRKKRVKKGKETNNVTRKNGRKEEWVERGRKEEGLATRTRQDRRVPEDEITEM